MARSPKSLPKKKNVWRLLVQDCVQADVFHVTSQVEPTESELWTDSNQSLSPVCVLDCTKFWTAIILAAVFTCPQSGKLSNVSIIMLSA